jgi:hypothetical protein
VRKS